MPKANPFYYNLPPLPVDFVGRRPLVEEIATDLHRPRGDSWAIIGGRRFGKTGVLRAIEFRLLRQLEWSQDEDRHVFPLVVDLRGSEPDTQRSVYGRIVRLLHRALSSNRILDLDLSHTRLQEIAESETKAISFYRFEDVLDDLALHFEEQHGPFRLALLLDEADAVLRFDWAETFFNQLRALIYDGLLKNTIKLVLAGGANILPVRQSGSPLLNAVKVTHLEALTAFNMRVLIARGGSISDDVAHAVQWQSGGHPFIAQYLLHHLWDETHGLTRATLGQVDRLVQQMQRESTLIFEGWWEAIGESGRLAYAFLVNNKGWVPERTMLLQLPHTEQPLTEGLTALTFHGLVRRNESGEQYRAIGALFEDWYQRNVNTESGASTQPDLLAERDSLRRELQLYSRNLYRLREQKAKYGLDIPISLLNALDDVQAEIERVRSRLHEIESELDRRA